MRVFEHFLTKKNIKPGIYNAGFENMSILRIANKIKNIVPSKIIISKSKDVRSYRLDSSKLKKQVLNHFLELRTPLPKIKTNFVNKKLKIRKK